MEIAITANESHLPGLEITLASVLVCSDQLNLGRIWILDAGINEKSKQSLIERLRRFTSLSIDFYEPVDPQWKSVRYHHACGQGPYLWFEFVQQSHASRVVCLDSDLLITCNLAELACVDTKGHAVAGVVNVVRHLRDDCPDPKIAHKHGDSLCLNTGVVVVDCEQWRQEAYNQKLLEFLHQHERNSDFWDQTALNSVILGDFHPLDYRWNRFPEYLGFAANLASTGGAEEGVYHLWKNAKPWLAFNYLETTALWYALSQVYYDDGDFFDWRRVPDRQKRLRQIRASWLMTLAYRIAKKSEMRQYWESIHKAFEKTGPFEQHYQTVLSRHKAWWLSKCQSNPSTRLQTP